MDPKVNEFLKSVAAAADRLDRVIDDLTDRCEESEAAEADEIRLALPGLRIRRRELDARFAALAAAGAALEPPTAAALDDIRRLTGTIADLSAARASVSVIVQSIGALLAAVPRTTSGAAASPTP